MPHEGPHRSWLKLTPDLLAYALSPEREVLLRLDLPSEDASLVLQMSAADARQIAEALAAKAAEAEKKR